MPEITRQLKPLRLQANVLVDGSGRAYLADFGLSAVEDAEILHWTSQSASASTGGTVRWQAPELFEPEPESSAYNDSTNRSSGPFNTKATDVYAWSCAGYEVSTLVLQNFRFLLE
jgi:serine/threonine protein kinase